MATTSTNAPDESPQPMHTGQYRDAVARAEKAVAEAVDRHGRDSLEHAFAITELGLILAKSARDTEAKDHLRLAASIGGALLGAGRCAEAEDVARQVVLVYETSQEQGHRDHAMALMTLATILLRRDKLKESLRCCTRASEILRVEDGERSPGYARSLNTLGGIYREMGRFPEAETAFRQALDILQTTAGAGHPDTAEALNNLGGLLRDIGQVDEAEPICRRVLDITRDALGEDHPHSISALNNLGQSLTELGRLAEAEPLLVRALELADKIHGRDHPDTGVAARNLASLHHDMGRYSEAKRLYERATTIARRSFGDRHTEYASCLSHAGCLYYSMEAYRRALSLLKKAYEIDKEVLGSEHPLCARDLMNLGNAWKMLGELPRAMEAYGSARGILAKAFGRHHPDYALCLQMCTDVFEVMGKHDDAVRLLRDAVALEQELNGEAHPAYASSICNLASALNWGGDVHEAKTLFERAGKIYRGIGATALPQYAVILGNLGWIAVRERRPDRALAMLVEAMRIERQIAHDTFAVSSEATRQGMLARLWTNVFGILSLVVGHLKEDPAALKAAFNEVVRQKGLDGEVHLAQRVWGMGEGTMRQQPHWARLYQIRRQLAAIILDAGHVRADDPTSQINALASQIEDLESGIAGEMPSAELARRLERADLDAVVDCLPEGSALIEYVRSPIFDYEATVGDSDRVMPARYIAFVMAKAGGIDFRMFDLGTAEPIDDMISAFRDELHPPPSGIRSVGVIRRRDAARLIEIGTAVRKAVLDPLTTGLREVRDLFVSPDGDLSLLPFAVLPVDANTFVIDHYRVNYIGASRDLVRLGDNTRVASSSPMVVADPDFDFCHATQDKYAGRTAAVRLSRAVTRGDLCFQPLPGTRKEGEKLARLLGTDRPLLREAATVAGVLASRSPRILHMATHGFFCPREDADIPKRLRRALDAGIGRAEKDLDAMGLEIESDFLRSGLALAGVNVWARGRNLPAEMHNGILTAEDVIGMDLLGTELVVLSACDTGLGVVHLGEGVFGLRRAFTLAGARTLVMSLWKVGDQETQELMTEFYERILRGEPRSEALRQAQLSLRKKHDSPAIWGAFICQGDPRPIPPQ